MLVNLLRDISSNLLIFGSSMCVDPVFTTEPQTFIPKTIEIDV